MSKAFTPEGFLQSWRPVWPYVSNDNSRGIFKQPRERMDQFKFIQINTKKTRNLMIVDLDRKNIDWRDAEDHLYDLIGNDQIPTPNYYTQNPLTGNLHVGWRTKGFASTDKSINLFSDVVKGLRKTVSGDKSFTHFITRNPLHDYQKTTWLTDEAYNLSDFFPYIDTSEEERKPVQNWDNLDLTRIFSEVDPEEGTRQTTLFHQVRKYAYRVWRDCPTVLGFEDQVFCAAIDLNAGWSNPLPTNEVENTVRAICKWVATNFTEEAWSLRQSAVSRRRQVVVDAPARWARVLDLREQGLSISAIADREGLTLNATKQLVRRAKNNSAGS